jgi:hypothetical protein
MIDRTGQVWQITLTESDSLFFLVTGTYDFLSETYPVIHLLTGEKSIVYHSTYTGFEQYIGFKRVL